MKLRAKKSLGQHFLTSKSALNKIIETAQINPDEHIMEIGPGTGILTRELLKSSAKVIAIEKDDRAFELLSREFADDISKGKLRLYKGDVLDTEILDKIFSENNINSYKIVANIPYYITGAILEMFLEMPRRDLGACLSGRQGETSHNDSPSSKGGGRQDSYKKCQRKYSFIINKSIRRTKICHDNTKRCIFSGTKRGLGNFAHIKYF